MNEIFLLLIIVLLGGVLGIVFFGGLWFTIKKGVDIKNPALWFSTSLLLRLSVVLLGFYFCLKWSGLEPMKTLVACLMGFLVTRTLMIRYVKPETK